MKSTILWMLAALLLFPLCACRDHKQNSNAVSFNKFLSISWTINSRKKTIRFKVKAKIDENANWFLIGFEPQKHKAPVRATETRGDAFVVWRQIVNSGKNKTFTWNVTDCNTIHEGTLQTDKIKSYHLAKNQIKYKDGILTAIVWRYLDTKDKEDVMITKRSMFMFGSYSFGIKSKPSKKWKHELQQINNLLNDIFVSASNVSFYFSKREKGGRNFVERAGQLAEQHWIGLVVGMSAFLTILITCAVYCLAKKAGGIKKKHVSMSFHKETEYDDEAKVAFLQSEET